jgi:uncharacterized membrane protein YcgQ (UPF0703/DUF1980 family)
VSAGDVIQESIMSLNVYFKYFSFFYILIFVFLFIYVILNIMLVIVQQTLFHVRQHERTRKRMVHRLLRSPNRASFIGKDCL